MKEIITDPLIFFIQSVFFGMSLFLLYDIVRAVRKILPHKRGIILIEDILFWIFVAIISFYFLCTYNDGELRGFFFMGVIGGMALYYRRGSKMVLPILIKIGSYPIRVVKLISAKCQRPWIHGKRNLRWQLKKEKKQVTMALKRQTRRGGRSGNTKESK